MTRKRMALLAAAALVSAALTFVVRDLVYELIVVPVSYVAWQMAMLMDVLPELVRWAGLVTILGFIVAWQLVPNTAPARRSRAAQRVASGKVEQAATWLARARDSNYFKWQLAHRLGLVAISLEEMSGQSNAAAPNPIVGDYLHAGLHRSFVDFPSTRTFLRRPPQTPLDVDPDLVVEYLETQAFMEHGRNANSF